LKVFKAPIIHAQPKVTTGKYRFDAASVKKVLSENYPLLSVLVGFMLVSLSIGPFQNGDTAWEYEAVLGVTKSGLPYAYGQLMNQPPLGFYIQAVFAQIFGLSINNGTFLVTLFGLGCVVLIYEIGRTLYDKTTGFFAALIFAFSPWHLIMSRAFLIDAQCLFFSLLSLLVGILAVRRGLFKLFLVSGIIFAAAFNTKLYAIFTLIPLLLFFFYRESKNLKRLVSWSVVFFIPVLLSTYLWYQTITGVGLASIFSHADLNVQSTNTVAPSYFFVSNLLTNYTLGWFLVDAAILSVIVCFALRQRFQKFWVSDIISLVTIVCVIAVNIYLGVTLNLKSPYLNAVKFDYQILPFFSLLAASLVTKSTLLFNLAKQKQKAFKITVSTLALAGLALVAAGLLYNMNFDHLISSADFMIFKVEPNVNLGYSLFNYAPIRENSLLMYAQYLGLAVALAGVVWFSRRRLTRCNLALKC
jgi:4-amino-4-deoxy-L-arabinose transferase-like glycosyltransferase